MGTVQRRPEPATHRGQLPWQFGLRPPAGRTWARLCIVLALIVLACAGLVRPAVAGPFDDDPVKIDEGTTGGSVPARVQAILDAAQAAMPGTPQDGWGAGTVASQMPDPQGYGGYYDLLFVAWVDSDVAGLEKRMAAADGDRETIFTRWGGVRVLRSETGPGSELAWRWAEGDLMLAVEVRTVTERETTEPYLAAIADAMHDAVDDGQPPPGQPPPDDSILIAVIGILVGLGTVGALALAVKLWLGHRSGKPKSRPRPAAPRERVLTDVLGRRHTYVQDDQGRWINPETGGQLDESLWDEYNRNLPANQAFIQNERARQAARDTEFDREMDRLVAEQKQQARDLHALQQMAKSLMFNPDRIGLWRGPGEPGDMWTNLEQLREQLASGKNIDRRKLEAVQRLYRDHCQGKVLTEGEIPSDMDQIRDVMSGTMDATLREVVTGQGPEGGMSWRALGVRVLANIVTVGQVELLYTPLESLYTMHDYVQKGGNSALEGFLQSTGNVLKGEIFSVVGQVGAKKLFGAAKNVGKVQPQLPRTPRPRAPSHYTSAAVDMRPHLAGMPEANIRHAQRVAQKNNVQIFVRPTNPEAKALIEKGLARPKPMAIKNKTINSLDTYLGAGTNDVGKVGHFKPKLPPKNSVPPEVYEKVKKRYVQRLNEYRNQAEHIKDLKTKGKILERNGVLHDAATGKPYSGDHDLFEILDAHGNPCPESLKQHVLKELQKPPFEVQHGAHLDWDYSHYAQAPGPGGAQSPQQIAKGIDQTIRKSHSPGNEPLIRFGPGTVNPVSGSYYTGV